MKYECTYEGECGYYHEFNCGCKSVNIHMNMDRNMYIA